MFEFQYNSLKVLFYGRNFETDDFIVLKFDSILTMVGYTNMLNYMNISSLFVKL